MINLTESEFNTVKKILNQHVPNAKIFVFGSRVYGKIKPHSDLDLAINAGYELSASLLALIEDDFEKSSLVFRVDIHDWHVLNEHFKKNITAAYESFTA